MLKTVTMLVTLLPKQEVVLTCDRCTPAQSLTSLRTSVMKRDYILIGVTGQFMSSASASQGRRTHDPGSRYMK